MIEKSKPKVKGQTMKEPLVTCDWLSTPHEKNEHKIATCLNPRPSAPIVTAAKDMSAQALESGALGEASAPAAPPDTLASRISQLILVYRANNKHEDVVSILEDALYRPASPTEAAPKDQTQAAIDAELRELLLESTALLQRYREKARMLVEDAGSEYRRGEPVQFLVADYDSLLRRLAAILPILRNGK